MNLILSLLMLFLVTLVFGWVTHRIWRIQRSWLRWLTSGVTSLLTLISLLALVLALRGLYLLNKRHTNPAPSLQVTADAAQIKRGAHVAQLCVQCHSSTGNLPLDGGENILAELGVLHAPNLTPGGELATWSDGAIVRAIREGIGNDGQALWIMPSDQYRHLGDEDVAALVAYLRSQPAVTRTTPAKGFGLLGMVVIGADFFSNSVQPPISAPVAAPERTVTAEYGNYLIAVAGCRECHGEQLEGVAKNEFLPAGPNLPLLTSAWSDAQFIQTIRSGVDPYGKTLDNESMPWRSYAAAFTDDDLQAILLTIRSLAPVTTSALVGITPPAVDASAGEKLFFTYCAACHSTGTDKKVGPGLAGLFALGGPTLPDGVDYGGNLPNGQPINAENVAAWIRSGGQGKIGVMPPMAGLKEEEMSDLIDYLRLR
jgi:cytochrome c2